MHRIECPSCSHRLKYADEHAGKRVKCQKCQHSFRLPGEQSQARPLEHHTAQPDPAPPLAPSGPAEVRGKFETATCAACGGPANEADRYRFHGYKTRTKLNTKYDVNLVGTVRKTTEYRYEDFYQGADYVCKACIGRLRATWFRRAAVVCLVGWPVILAATLFVNTAIHLQKDRAIIWLPLGLAVVIGGVTLLVYRFCEMRHELGERLALKANRERLKGMGLRVLGRGSEPTH